MQHCRSRQQCDTGEPLKKVSLRLVARSSANGRTGAFANPNFSAQGYAAASEADGSFQITGIEPGQYILTAQKGGFLHFSYGAKGPTQNRTTILTLSPGQQMTGLSPALFLQAVISGKVVDQDGDPVDGGNVQAVSLTWMRGKQQYNI